MIEAIILSFALAHRIRSLQDQVDKDVLTGLNNRNAMQKFLDKQIQLRSETNEPLCMMVVDIDNFKNINDTYGHSTGDEILVIVSNTLKWKIRYEDFIARWGGEEFAIIMPKTKMEGAVVSADNIRKLVSATEYPVDNPVTISIGVAEHKMNESMRDFFRRADTALYVAKKSGKNKVEIAAVDSYDLQYQIGL
jgi:diguanylate cyclase (GGDEF)-like protein